MTRAELEEILDGRRMVVSVSGGKDSTAVCLHLMEMGYSPDEFDRVFFDTGWEQDATLEYLRGPLAEHIGPIEWRRADIALIDDLVPVAEDLERQLGQSPSPMVRIILKKAIFPARHVRFCTQQLKVRPAVEKLAEVGAAVTVVGIRGAESKARSIMAEWDIFHGKFGEAKWSGDVWRPLIDWTLDDVIAIHQRAGLKPNPLYLHGSASYSPAERVGCWPCIFARKSEIRAIANQTPERIEFIKALEGVVGRLRDWRDAESGKPPRTQPSPAWFHARMGKSNDGTRDGTYWPIQRVVEWSRTSRGGRQVELFTDTDGHQGCVRWGMCETGESMNKGEES